MKSSFTLFQKTFAYFLTCLFTFTIVSNCFPYSAYAQSKPLSPLSPEDQLGQLINEILMGEKTIKLISQRLLQDYEIQRPKFPLEGEKLLPGVREGTYCRHCHSDALFSSPTPSSPFPFHIPDFLNDPSFLDPRGGNSHWHSHSPEKKFELLHLEMNSLKTKVQQSLFLENTWIEPQLTIIKIYLDALSHYLITSLKAFPLSNPFDTLDETWQLRLPLNKIDQFKATLSKRETLQSTKEMFATLVYFKDDQMFFSDAFKIAIELSSFLQEQNEDAWLNILKLQTVEYLGRQLLKINSYWPETHLKNKEFFGKLSPHFRSLNHSFGSMLQDQERQRQTNFDQFLKNLLSTQDIPTLITFERYKDLLMSHTPQLWDMIGNRFEEYFETMDWINIEKSATQPEIKKAIYSHSFSLSEYDPREVARWMQTRILEIKKNFFHDHLNRHFLNPEKSIPEITLQEAEFLEQKYLAEYEKELTLDRILTWLASFDSSVPAAVRSAFEFLRLSAQIEGTEEVEGVEDQIAKIDEQIQALLLHDFNKHVSWGYTLLPNRKIDQSWQDSEMDKEEMKAMVPYPPDPEIPDLMPIQNFPKIKPIEMNPENFGVVLALLISSIGDNLFLIKHMEEFAKAKTKEELLASHQSLVDQVKTMLSTITLPIRAPREKDKIHEKEKLEEALEALEKLGQKIKRLDPKNTETLDDFFATTKEKVEFLKTKRAIITNVFRILDVPIESGTGNANQRWEEKPHLHHIQALKNQDGVLLSEVRQFLGDGMDAAETFSLLQASDFRYDKFQEEYPKKKKEFFKDLTEVQIEDAVTQNNAILAELRFLEKGLSHLHAAYLHPEYFIGTKGNLLYPETLEKLKRVQELRSQRKTIYLDKGGADLDEWLKGYIGTFMLRQALVAQDLLIRKNIDKVVHARSIDEIKEFILDPFIVDQALKLVEQEYPAQEWRINSFRTLHTRMMSELSEGFLDSYFDNSLHPVMFYGLLALQIILCFIPGAQLGAVAIGVFLLSDTLLQTGHDLLVKTPRAYHIIQSKEDFYLSSAIPEDIIAAGNQGPGGTNYENFDKMREGVFWEAVIAGGVSVLLLPWAKVEVKRAIQLFHTKTNWFIGLKIPLYAKTLGIEAGTPLTLSLVREKMAQRLGLPTQEFLELKTPKLRELTLSRLGKEEGAQFVQMVQFFNQKNILEHLLDTKLAQMYKAMETLGFEKEIPPLDQIRATAQGMLRQNAQFQGRPTLSPAARHYLEQQRRDIKEALQFLETHPTILEEVVQDIRAMGN